MFSVGIFLVEWNNVKIVPILKLNKNPAEASIYRPIALLCSISEPLIKVILNRMRVHITKNSLFANEQFGDGHVYSKHHLLRVTNLLHSKKGYSTSFAFLDIEKCIRLCLASRPDCKTRKL